MAKEKKESAGLRCEQRAWSAQLLSLGPGLLLRLWLARSLAALSVANAARWSRLRRTAGDSLEKDKLIGA